MLECEPPRSSSPLDRYLKGCGSYLETQGGDPKVACDYMVHGSGLVDWDRWPNLVHSGAVLESIRFPGGDNPSTEFQIMDHVMGYGNSDTAYMGLEAPGTLGAVADVIKMRALLVLHRLEGVKDLAAEVRRAVIRSLMGSYTLYEENTPAWLLEMVDETMAAELKAEKRDAEAAVAGLRPKLLGRKAAEFMNMGMTEADAEGVAAHWLKGIGVRSRKPLAKAHRDLKEFATRDTSQEDMEELVRQILGDVPENLAA
jgi:hypothetical protein